MAEAREANSSNSLERRDLLKWIGVAVGGGVLVAGVRMAVSDGGQAEEDFRQGLELHRKGRYEEAVGLFAKVAEARPQDVLPRILTGSAYANWGRFQEAAASFSQALGLDPGNAVVHLYRGEALLKMGLEAEARRDFEAAKALAAGDERVVSAASARLRSPAARSLFKDMTR